MFFYYFQIKFDSAVTVTIIAMEHAYFQISRSELISFLMQLVQHLNLHYSYYTLKVIHTSFQRFITSFAIDHQAILSLLHARSTLHNPYVAIYYLCILKYLAQPGTTQTLSILTNLQPQVTRTLTIIRTNLDSLTSHSAITYLSLLYYHYILIEQHYFTSNQRKGEFMIKKLCKLSKRVEEVVQEKRGGWKGRK